MASLASKMAQLETKAYEAARLAAKHGSAYQKQLQEAARLAAEHGSAYQKQLQSKASEAARFAAEHGSAYQKQLQEATMLAAEHGSAYQKQLQSKASEAAKLAAERGSAYQKQLQSKACEATRFAAKQGSEYHKSLMERNKQYVVDPPTVEKCRELSKQLFYTRLASLPGRYESLWKEVDGVKHLLKNRKNLKVEDLGVAALFCIELYAWLCTGEIVGRGFTLTGYDV